MQLTEQDLCALTLKYNVNPTTLIIITNEAELLMHTDHLIRLAARFRVNTAFKNAQSKNGHYFISGGRSGRIDANIWRDGAIIARLSALLNTIGYYAVN